MLNKILQLLTVVCSHGKLSQPFAAAVQQAAVAGGSRSWDSVPVSGRHYVVCLDCGKKFDYDWKQMKVVR